VDLKKIVAIVRQVPDPVEGLEVAESGTALDMDEVSFIVNEYDNHALEQALTLKQAVGGSVTVLAMDHGDVDETLYTASARGADDIIKLPLDDDLPPSPQAAARMFAEVIKEIDPELVVAGVQADDELEGLMVPLLASHLQFPYLGVIRGVQLGDQAGTLRAFKELGGAVMAQMSVRLPAVLGILAADERPKYVSVSRIRAAMKSAKFQEKSVTLPTDATNTAVQRLYCPEVGERAEILEGSDEEVAARITEILVEKGIIK
jgi:electron transfer flavoprotein beta subunit